ncbi:MAG: TSUP family transporter [Cyanobium sp.]
MLNLPPGGFQRLVRLVLLASALRFLLEPRDPTELVAPKPLALAGWGAGLGLLAGLSGTGGGVFLTPLLLFQR